MRYLVAKPALLSVIVAIAATSTTSRTLAAAVPTEAALVVAAVHRAAASKNYSELKKLMAPEFTWSFGGDACGTSHRQTDVGEL